MLRPDLAASLTKVGVPGSVLDRMLVLYEGGSTAHGMSVGQDDTDYYGVFIEPLACWLGVSVLDHVHARTQPEGRKSQPGDIDVVLWGLKKFSRLLITGNPTVFQTLWLPQTYGHPAWQHALPQFRKHAVHRRLLHAYLGYATDQSQAFLGLKKKRITRPDHLAVGFDTKYAAHAVRLCFEGIMAATTGQLSLPLPDEQLGLCRSIRQGRVSALLVGETIKQLLDALRGAVDAWQGPDPASSAHGIELTCMALSMALVFTECGVKFRPET